MSRSTTPLTLSAIVARGGTSKGLFFEGSALCRELRFPAGCTVSQLFDEKKKSETESHISLSEKATLRQKLTRSLLRVVLNKEGLPDPSGAQIDGMGGATSSTSKVVILEKRASPAASNRSGDVEKVVINYIFGQVATKTPEIDWSTACGNLASAVGVVAEFFGLVKSSSTTPPTSEEEKHGPAAPNPLSVWQVNKGYPLEIQPLPPDHPIEIAGVPGFAPGCVVNFILGKKQEPLLPLGASTEIEISTRTEDSAEDTIQPPGMKMSELAAASVRSIPVTVVDGAVISVFCAARDLGLELPGDSNFVADLQAYTAAQTARATLLVDRVRRAVAEKCGVADWGASAARVVWVGRNDESGQLRACVSAPGRPRHHAFTGTGAVNLAIAAAIPGTVVADELGGGGHHTASGAQLRFVHPAGPMDVTSSVRFNDARDAWEAESAGLVRSARVLMKGEVFLEGD
ncbi:unnamed protein product [Amoebophrya sp. A120]|nr:unnamed protein product [Amoebophrya sp. A120]|eukprot:GSA120T00021619001.1